MILPENRLEFWLLSVDYREVNYQKSYKQLLLKTFDLLTVTIKKLGVNVAWKSSQQRRKNSSLLHYPG